MTEQPFKVGYTRLGNSGLWVSKIILGCMTYGSSKWVDWVLEGDEALEHFRTAYELGINTWDTADTYSNGVSEQVLGDAIRKLEIPREKLVILTKLFAPAIEKPEIHQALVPDPVNQGYVNRHGLSRKHIFDAVKASLVRLGLDYVDVLQCHRFDYNTPIEETMDALHDVVKAGYARYIGMSSCHARQFIAMQNYAKNKGQTQFISMQNFHNAIYREEEREMIPYCKETGVGVIPWSPLGRGYLARPFAENRESIRTATDRMYQAFFGAGDAADTAAMQTVNKAVEDIAKKRGKTMAQIALAWSIAQPGISAPIIGSTKVESIVELAHATEIVLTKEEIEAISAGYRPRKIFGHK